MASYRKWTARVTEREWRRGVVFLAVYAVLLPVLVAGIDSLLGDAIPVATINLVCYGIVVAAIVVAFLPLFQRGLTRLVDWALENLFALATGLFGWAVLRTLADFLPLPVDNPIYVQYAQQFAVVPVATGILLVALWPVAEEVLFRGLLFGAFRRHSRKTAYILSIVVFVLFKTWQMSFVGGQLDLRYLLVAVEYLPMAAALAWSYDNGGSIITTIILHAIMNGLTLAAIIN